MVEGNKGFRSTPEYKKFWKPLAWFTGAFIFLAGASAQTIAWLQETAAANGISVAIPPKIQVATGAA